MASEALEQLRAQRFQFLRAVYDASGGRAGAFLNMHEVSEEIGFDEALTDKVVDYLIGEHLLEWAAMGGIIELTHWGLKEVEEALAAPERPTDHFPALVVAQNYMHVGSMSNSQIQQGTTSSTQSFDSSVIENIRVLVHDTRTALPETGLDAEQSREVEADLATLDAQLDSPRPKSAILRESLNSARAVLEGALGGAVANASPQLPALIERFAQAVASLPM